MVGCGGHKNEKKEKGKRKNEKMKREKRGEVDVSFN